MSYFLTFFSEWHLNYKIIYLSKNGSYYPNKLQLDVNESLPAPLLLLIYFNVRTYKPRVDQLFEFICARRENDRLFFLQD